MDRVTDKWNSLAREVSDPFQPWLAERAEEFDNQSLTDWLREQDCSPQCRRAMASMMVTDNGVAADKQSWLGNLAMIAGGGYERYWTDTEVARCDGGNQRLAEALAAT